ncbi:alpha/beta fold hydrolase [Nocardioides sp. zg-536]|uniref:Alpha/beta fold hydrolase n=1 Tax=Nocardioides faecalis TaxID=2803858 RepID=A0A939BSM2_9ACTN|nr:alpha/beta fold hydrolase [Nocardioides faecalis]MBM9459774.1 alpha/beta fold hydrolase [Nocardioides faecalis]MBS4753449.1 alpha/beta fold hydrolase [Nocardioides faecalis]QVI58287.1 alpha/beta fold hydrolase [Nocardioides faecalis]
MTQIMAPWLLPEGYGRPALAALLRESSVLTEAGRFAARRSTTRVVRRRTPFSERSAARAAEPVLLIPGFLAGDWTLAAMSAELRERGFRTYRSRITANVNCTMQSTLTLEQRLEELAERRGTRVQIVGHSLGGMIARGLAARRPDLVAGIVTMGSPMRAPAAHHGVLTRGVRMLNRLADVGLPGVMGSDCVSGECAHLSFVESQEPLRHDVAMTNVYSRRDGIVDWRACIDPDGRPVEVRASHVGLVCDPRVIDIVSTSLLEHSDIVASAGGVLRVVETA